MGNGYFLSSSLEISKREVISGQKVRGEKENTLGGLNTGCMVPAALNPAQSVRLRPWFCLLKLEIATHNAVNR